MAPATRRACLVEGCNFGANGSPYMTLEGLSTQDAVLKDLELHLHMVHSDLRGSRDTTVRADSSEAKPDRYPRPEITDPATETEWNYFMESWRTYKRATKLSGQNICDQLWHCPSESLKKKLFNLGIKATNSESEILDGIKKLCVKTHNNLVNIIRFQEIKQEDGETIQQFSARLNGAANTCDFTVKCKCEENVSYSEKIQSFQFIRGLADVEIQERILSETACKDLSFGDIIKFGEAVETGKRSSNILLKVSSVNKLSYNKNANGSNKKCAFCGEEWHTGPNWRKFCKGASVNCKLCGKKGHLAKVCRSNKQANFQKESNLIESSTPETPSLPHDEESEALGFFCHLWGESLSLNHIGINEFGKWAKTKIEDHPEVSISIRPNGTAYKDLGIHKHIPTTARKVQSSGLADTGAQMIVIGPETIHAMGLKNQDLIPTRMNIKAANMGGMNLMGGIPVTIEGLDALGVERTTNQLAYVAKEVNRIFLSKAACRDLGIISNDFPTIGAYSMEANNFINNKDEINYNKSCTGLSDHNCKCPKRELPPEPPKTCPFPPTVENLGKLENWIRAKYGASAFNVCNNQPLPLMKDSPPLELFIDKDAKPIACHKAAQIPIHFKKIVEEEIRRDVKLGVLEEVPRNTPTTWCSRMCIQTKKNGRPRRVIDLQPVNKFAVRQTYIGESPFEIVNEVPINTFRTTLDAWNGYHSVPIKEEDRHVTTFITPWGRFRYRTTPQGFLAAQDAYNHRFDLITRDFKHKKRCVDDSIIWGETIEEIFKRTCEYLSLTSAAGIIMNPEKFKFGKKCVEFLGFELKEDSIEPGKDLINSIREFPRPQDLSSTRSWFGLIEQVAWGFSKTKVMEPFRHLLKPKAEFNWTQELNRAFEISKDEIIQAIKLGVKTFKPDKQTCLATDWSKEGIGFCLLQKRCECKNLTPICCPGGWELTFCSSRFTTPAESRYAPVEGECLAVVWGLKKTKYFIAGCKNLIIATDHKPLLGILNDKELDNIDNTRLVKLKEKTMKYQFNLVHVPGIKHKIADATSRYPASQEIENQERLTRTIVRSNRSDPEEIDYLEANAIEQEIEAGIYSQIMMIGGEQSCQAIGLEDVMNESEKDNEIKSLVETIRNGTEDWPSELSQYSRVKDSLSQKDGIVVFKGRIVIPKALRGKVLEILHGAHQGCQGMCSRASLSIWWPGLSIDIEKKRAECQTCIEIAPSQPAMPSVQPERPEYPMQRICSDIAYIQGKTFVVIVDRFTNWPSVYPADGANGLIKALRYHFVTYGAAEEISSDGGPEYVAANTQEFLKRWRVKHRVSSAYYPRSNMRAELGVKVIKRLLRDNLGTGGSLETDKVARALLNHRNTPNVELGRSPAQLLYGRNLKDHLPGTIETYKQRKEWIMLREERERALSEKYGKIKESLDRGTRKLKELELGDVVQIQNQRGKDALRWSKSGVIVEVRNHDQYGVRMDGSGRVTLRNRKFMRKIEPLYRRNNGNGMELDVNAEEVRRSARTRHEVDKYQAGG